MSNDSSESKASLEKESVVNETDTSNETIDIETIYYKPLSYHWFYTSYLAEKLIWLPLSNLDSTNLEKIYTQNIDDFKLLRKKSELERIDYLKSKNLNHVVTIKGGRFEVDLIDLVKRAIYWTEKNTSQVRRCLWFYKENNEQRFVPYEEEYSEFLEYEYEKTIKTNMFHKRIDFNRMPCALINQPKMHESLDESVKPKIQAQNSLSNEEAFVFHSTTIMLHFTQATMLDELGNLNSDAKRPRIVKRGVNEVVEKIEPDEIEKIDHLCFVVHGIGEGCDLRFRPIVDCVDDFREIGAYITQSHLKPYIDSSQINGRVEFLPISWHQELHGDPTGVDKRLKPITLPSIPKLRQYSNSTILDVLFYTSPIYCQTIISKVGNEINRLTKIFLERNPDFKGKISLVGHSLGSVILFDLLSHQFKNEETKENIIEKPKESETIEKILKRLGLVDYQSVFEKEKITVNTLYLLNEEDLIKMGIELGPRRVLLNEFKHYMFKKEQEQVSNSIKTNLDTLKRQELEKKSADYFKYGLAGTGQLVIRYPQLSFKVEKFFALGSPIGIFQTIRGIEKLGTDFEFPTCSGFFNIFHPFDPVAYRCEPLICSEPDSVLKPVLMPHHKGRKRMHLELREGLSKVGEDLKTRMYDQLKNAWSSLSKLPKTMSNQPSNTSNESIASVSENTISVTEQVVGEQVVLNEKKKPIDMGKLNKGRRIDYVLQESPIESFNEYLFAIASHACYWESEDTLLLIIKEIYGYENLIDANTELQLTEQQQQQQSWLTQTAATTISESVQKTFSYFQIGIPQSLTSVLTSSLINNSAGSSNSKENQS